MPVVTINPAKHSLKKTEVSPRPRECREVQDDPEESDPKEPRMKWQTQMNHTELTDLASITQSPPPMIVPVYLLSQFGGAIYHLSLTSGSTNTSSDGTAKKEDQAEVQQVHAAPKPQLSRGNEGVYWISEASNIVLTSPSPSVIQRQ